jgi:hypothetical protein
MLKAQELARLAKATQSVGQPSAADALQASDANWRHAWNDVPFGFFFTRAKRACLVASIPDIAWLAAGAA